MGGFPWKETKPLKKNKEGYKFDFYLNNCFLMGPPHTEMKYISIVTSLFRVCLD